jgi:hypothetical protein
MRLCRNRKVDLELRRFGKAAMMKLDQVRVVALPRKLVELRILGLEYQLNRHLIKLVAFEFSEELRRHFRRGVKNWLNEIKGLRFKPDRSTGSVRFYFDLLFDYPFGGVELENMQSQMDLVSDEYEIEAAKSAEEMVDWLRAFHRKLAGRLHDGEDVLDLIPE